MLGICLVVVPLILIGSVAYLLVAVSRRPPTEPADSGPETLEQLYSARLARGDIEGPQYVQSIRAVSKQMQTSSRRIRAARVLRRMSSR